MSSRPAGWDTPPVPQRGPRWVDAVCILILCLWSIFFYRHIALTNRVLAGADAMTYFYPYREYAAEALREGRLPLWNPYLFLGVPFFANPQAAVLYPLNLLLFWLPTPQLVAWSIVLHAALAAVLAYLYARLVLHLAALPALLGAAVFGFGGFLSGQIEHVNQLNVSAWFPLLLLLWEQRPRSRLPALLGLGGVIGLGLLAGHTQSSYISLAGLGLYALLPPAAGLAYRLACRVRRRATDTSPPPLRPLLGQAGTALLDYALACATGLALAAVQILPALELSALSIRSGGLSYREAVAFSLKPLPRLLRYAFLPPWGGNLADVFGGSFFTEFLAYVGLAPLLLAGFWGCDVGSRLLRRHSSSLHEIFPWTHLRLLALAGGGFLLALGAYNPFYLVLYKLVPGMDLFRVPARWLLWYAFALPMLAAVGLDRLGRWLQAHVLSSPTRRLGIPASQMLLVGITLLELLVAARALPLSHPTAPQAYTSLRTAPAHIMAAQGQETAPGRFLSMSDILFDPGDLDDIHRLFQNQLDPQALYDYIVSLKRQEIIAPNLPLAWRLYAVDGYDGGLLPLARYIDLQRLFLPPSEILTDGRLRERLERVPPSRLLSLLGVEYVITDKVNDVWIENVFYDLAFEAALGTGAAPSISTQDLPDFMATGLGLVSFVEGTPALPDGTPVARLELETGAGQVLTFTLPAGQDANDAARIEWGEPQQVARLTVTPLLSAGRLHIRGLSLIDSRDGSNVPLILSTDGRYGLVHSGDVKIYHVLDALPRAYVVHHARILDDESALVALADPAFDPGQAVVLASGQPLATALPPTPARVTVYAAERVVIEAQAAAPGYLVLSDAWYPGWQATVDGAPAAIERANIHFRAVYLDSGPHTVEFVYHPVSWRIGLTTSLLSLLGWSAAWIVAPKRRPVRSGN